MERLIELIFVNIDKVHFIAPLVALFTSLGENRGKGKTFIEYIVTVFLSMSIAGIIIEYLPTHTIFISILVGILSGVLVDDLFVKLVTRFPTFIDDIIETVFTGVKQFIKKWLGNSNE